MAPYEHSFGSLLRDEIRLLLQVLPPALSGGAPVSALLFQPTAEGGRLVYLDTNVRPDDPIHIDPGQVSENFFFDLGDKSPWVAAEEVIQQTTLDEYLDKNPSVMRLKLANQDALRYSSIQFDQNGVVSAGTRMWMHYLVPPPVYHHTIGWWKRLPRLGQVYSLGEQLEHKNLLLICGMSVGIRVLAIRLKLLLHHHESATRRTPFQIADSVASDRRLDADEFQYLLVNMLMAHHWFYAYDPVALKIFARLGSDPNLVLKMHGWPASGLSKFDTNAPLNALIDQLAQDLSFLIYACTTWSAPGENKRKSSADLYDQLKVALRTTLAVTCGTPRYATASRINFKYQDHPADYMCIESPKELQDDDSSVPELPLLSRGQLLSKVQELEEVAEAYLLSASPIGKPEPLAKWNNIKVCCVQGERAYLQQKEMGKWLTGYTRARCVMKLMGEKQAVKHGAA
jgi:hypothetical protein